MKRLAAGLIFGSFMGWAGIAAAQATPDPPSRSDDWDKVTTVTAVAAGLSSVLMPRVFYANPEVTEGWKGRWHVSVLAPVMTQVGLTLLNEYKLKDGFQGPRPGCPDELGSSGCTTYGMMSTHSYFAFQSLGHGAAVFLFDTTKHSAGRFNGGAFAGHVATPLVLSVITGIGRGVGDWETGGQIFAGGAAGLGLGFLTGMTYALMQRPMCGYSGALICW